MFSATKEETFDLDDDFLRDAFKVNLQNCPNKQPKKLQSVTSKDSISQINSLLGSTKPVFTVLDQTTQNGSCETTKETIVPSMENKKKERFKQNKKNVNLVQNISCLNKSEIKTENKNNFEMDLDDGMDAIFSFNLDDDSCVVKEIEPQVGDANNIIEMSAHFRTSSHVQKAKPSIPLKSTASNQLTLPITGIKNETSNSSCNTLSSSLADSTISQNMEYCKENSNFCNKNENFCVTLADNLSLCQTKRTRLSSSNPLNKSCEISKMRKRKFPGPAGVLPALPPDANFPVFPQAEKPLSAVNHSSSAQDFLLSQSAVDEFEKSSWQAMLTDLGSEEISALVTEYFNIKWILQQAGSNQLPKGKVPVLCVILKSVSYKGSEASATLADKTGEMNATVHRNLYEDYHEKLLPGTVLILKQVTVFSPSLRKHYLIINPKNVVSIYGAEGDKIIVVPCDYHHLASTASDWIKKNYTSPQMVVGDGIQTSPHFLSPLNPIVSLSMSKSLPNSMEIYTESNERKMYHNRNAISKTSTSLNQVSIGDLSSGVIFSARSEPKIKTDIVCSTPINSSSDKFRGVNLDDFSFLEEQFSSSVEENKPAINDANISGSSNQQSCFSKSLGQVNSSEGCDFFEDDFDSLFLSIDDKTLKGDVSS